jgi:hypothetical protein
VKKKVVSKVGTTMVVVMVVAAAKLADWRPAAAAVDTFLDFLIA